MTSTVISFPEVARLIGVSIPTLYRWNKTGRFPKPIRLGPARVGFFVSDVDAWLAERKAEAA
jgi:prophage regulatory protein